MNIDFSLEYNIFKMVLTRINILTNQCMSKKIYTTNINI